MRRLITTDLLTWCDARCRKPLVVRGARQVGKTRAVTDLYQGALAEQFVGQEPIAATGDDLHYRARAARGSSDEVDYLVDDGSRIVPIEVKSGQAGRLRSLRLLLDTYPGTAPGVVVSSAPYAELPDQQLSFVPLYSAATSAPLRRGGRRRTPGSAVLERGGRSGRR